jgi:hypothetical protein
LTGGFLNLHPGPVIDLAVHFVKDTTMTVPSTYRSIIVITNNASLTALLTGYCLGKNIHLTPLQSLHELSELACNSLYKLIVIDARYDSRELSAEEDAMWRRLEKYDGHHVIVIYRQSKPDIPSTFSHFHMLKEFELVPAIDKYLGQFFQSEKSHERRVRERRQLHDRRTSAQRLDGNASIHAAAKSHLVVKMGEFEVNHLTKSVFKQGRDLQLTRKEFELFSLLMEERAEICSAEAIVNQLWPNTRRASKSDLYQCIHTLRKKLEQNPCQPECLLTIKGVGYQLRL